MPFDQGRNNGGGGGGGGGHRWYTADDAVKVLYFLRQAEIEGQIWQGIKASEAFDAACRIMNLPIKETRQHILKDKGQRSS